MRGWCDPEVTIVNVGGKMNEKRVEQGQTGTHHFWRENVLNPQICASVLPPLSPPSLMMGCLAGETGAIHHRTEHSPDLELRQEQQQQQQKYSKERA